MAIADTAAGPVKIVLERRVRPGSRPAFEAWVRELVGTAARTPELQGSSVLSREDDCFILLRFASQEALDAWRGSAEVESLLARGEALAAAPAIQPCVKTGLETWFTVPGMPTPAHAPPRWKMALVTWVALMPLVHAMSQVVPQEWPPVAKLPISTLVPVCLLTWLVMPNATRLLQRWLYRPQAGGREAIQVSASITK